jgi:hypothetical protein
MKAIKYEKDFYKKRNQAVVLFLEKKIISSFG